MLTLIAVNAYAFIHINAVDQGFENESEMMSNAVSSASYYLTANAYAFHMLTEIEKSNYAAIPTYLPKIKENIEAAIEFNGKASVNSVYREDKRDLLANYNYNALIAEYGMNPDIADPIVEYFKEFDLIGIYQENGRRLEDIRALIQEIEDQYSRNELDLTLFWQVDQKFSHTNIFGNYVSIIAKNVFQ
jgi:hypothetical protein